MSYENCFDCPFFKSKPERCISKDLEKECKEYKKECKECGSELLCGYCPNCNFAELEHGFVVGRYLAEKLKLQLDRINDVLEQGNKDYKLLCKNEMEVFGKTTYESYKEFMIDSIKSGEYPELQAVGFL